MKKIIDNKIYDTDKAENIFSYRRAYKVRDILSQSGYTYYAWSDVDVYKTKKEIILFM